ncbi:MAG: hypothetical protein WB783_06645 [Arenicellales bacterium]
MDAILILAPTRWRLRRAIARVNRVLNELGLAKHPGKTWMGPLDRGFDFLGYHHTRAGLMPAQDTVTRFHTRLSRLYEQGADPVRIGVYRQRWRRWVCGGLPESIVLVEHSTKSHALLS